MTPKPVIAFDWYRSFVEFLVNSEAHTWFSKIIIFGELAIAAGLIFGAFVGVPAFFGGFMNWSFIMAGSASTNGMLFALATWLVLAWRNAGWIGLDRWLLPMIGTPWKLGRLFLRNKEALKLCDGLTIKQMEPKNWARDHTLTILKGKKERRRGQRRTLL